MHIPYVLTNLGKIKTSSVTSWATHFAVNKNFILAQPHIYICKNENMVSKLQAKYFHIYIPNMYTFVPKLPIRPYIHINMPIQPYQN